MANIKNLIAVDGSERIIWNPDVGHLEVFEGEQPKQNLLLSSRPYFTVKDIKLSPVKNFLALIGDNGVTIVELPRKWGRRYRGETKENQIFCRTFNINDRSFTCEKRLRTLHVAWHPLGYEAKQVLCILTNDNRLRFHDVTADLELQVVDLRIPLADRRDKSFNESDGGDTLCLGISMLNLGEFAICFDFGPPTIVHEPDILWPIYILMGSGDVYLIYTNHQNPTYSEHVIGPLTMLPQADDNYGADACSLIVLDSSPPMLAIATPTGTIYHCFAFPDKKGVLSKQTLYVYEAIELSRDLIANPDDPYSPHPMRLFKDPTSDIRYFCAHENGVHTVVLPILDSIQAECEIIEEKESFSEFLVCTRTSTPSDGLLNQEIDDQSTPRGLAVEIRQTGSVLLVLMPGNEMITHRISPATTLINRKRFPRRALETSRDSNDVNNEILNLSQVDASRAKFDEQIQQILKRKTSIPMLKLSENLEQKKQFHEVANRAVNVFQNEYLKKFDLAAEAITKKLNILEKDMLNQQEEYHKVEQDKTEVYNIVVALASKTEMVCKKQENLLARMDKILAAVSYGHPDLSESEAKLRRELSTINEKLHFYRDQLDSIVNKHMYHLNQKDPAFNTNSDLILSEAQMNGILETLSRQGSEIADLKRAVKARESTD
jgi:nuclear pore complex protein Nup88